MTQRLQASDDPVHKLAVSFVLASAVVALAGAGQLSAVAALAAAVAAIGGVWGFGSLAPAAAGRAGGGRPLAVRAAGWVIVAVPMLLVVGRAVRSGGAGLLITATALTLVATALETPTPRSLLVRSWLGTGATVLAVSLSDQVVVKAAVLVAVAGTLISLARWSRRNGAPLGEVAEVAAGPGVLRAGMVDGGTARWSLGPAAAVLVVAGLLSGTLLTFLPDPPSPSGAGAGSWLEGLTGSAGSGELSAGSTRRVRSYVGGSMDLNSRGDLGDRPLFTVPAADAGRWRSAVLDVYDGTRWVGTDGTAPSVQLGDGYHAVAEAAVDPVRGREQHAAQVELLPNGFFPADVPVLAPGPVTSVVFPTTPGAELPELRMSPGLRLTADFLGSGAVGYRVRWADLSTPATGPRLGAQDRSRYVSLPPGVPQRVYDLSRGLVRDPADPLAAVQAVETELHARARYNLDSPVARPGDDAVDHFLFTAREGFCEHFAAAEVVLLRAAGIPARVATGFVASASDLGDDGRIVVTSAQAHAWVEVWVPEHGWVATDPTAGARRVPNAVDSIRVAVERFLGGLPAPVLIAAGLVVLVLGGWAVVVLRRRIGRSTSSPTDDAAVPRLPAGLAEAYRAFQTALAGCGIRPAPGEPIRSLAVSAALAGGLSAAELERLAGALAVVERAAFGRHSPSEAELSAAEQTVRSATRALLAVLAQAVPSGAR